MMSLTRVNVLSRGSPVGINHTQLTIISPAHCEGVNFMLETRGDMLAEYTRSLLPYTLALVCSELELLMTTSQTSLLLQLILFK